MNKIVGFDLPLSHRKPLGIVLLTVLMWLASSSLATLQTPQPAPTETTIASSGTPSASSQSTTFVATVRSVLNIEGMPTGEVEFFDAEVSLGTATLASNQGILTASLTVSSLAEGPHPVTARYLGDAGFAKSVSMPVLQIVTP